MPAKTYTGRDVGKIIEPLLQEARERIWVATPYIGAEYARLLLEKYRNGVDVRLVTSDSPTNSGAFQILFKRPKERVDIIPSILAVLALWSIVIVYYGFQLLGLGEPPGFLAIITLLAALAVLGKEGIGISIVSGIIIAVAADIILGGVDLSETFFEGAFIGGTIYVFLKHLKFKTEGYTRPLIPILIYPTSQLVHAKIYIIDNTVITGSANLTRSGLWRNMETITIHEEPEAGEIVNQFLSIWQVSNSSNF